MVKGAVCRLKLVSVEAYWEAAVARRQGRVHVSRKCAVSAALNSPKVARFGKLKAVLTRNFLPVDPSLSARDRLHDVKPRSQLKGRYPCEPQAPRCDPQDHSPQPADKVLNTLAPTIAPHIDCLPLTDLCDQVVQQPAGQLLLVAVFVQATDLQLVLQLSLIGSGVRSQGRRGEPAQGLCNSSSRSTTAAARQQPKTSPAPAPCHVGAPETALGHTFASLESWSRSAGSASDARSSPTSRDCFCDCLRLARATRVSPDLCRTKEEWFSLADHAPAGELDCRGVANQQGGPCGCCAPS